MKFCVWIKGEADVCTGNIPCVLAMYDCVCATFLLPFVKDMVHRNFWQAVLDQTHSNSTELRPNLSVESNALQSPWILLFFFSFFWVLFLIYFLTFYLILHVSTVTEELYKTNWHITLPCRCCQMCSMIHCRDLGIQGSVLLQIMSRTISKASLVVWILHFCLVLKWYSLHRYSTRHCQQLIVCSRFKGRDCTLLNKEVWVISSHWNSAYIRVWLEVLLV